MRQLIKDKLSLLPMEPGCYLMKDYNNQIIYVGKAKRLKNRVKSYFTGSHNGKTARLVREIHDFEYIVTSTELESLILELNLIKKHDPKYNIMLTDDKHYPYIKITSERHPRLLIARRFKKDGGKYFGPYPNATAANETLRLLNKLYPLRKCHQIPPKVCLYYHIHQCLGPCEFKVDQEQYDFYTEKISRFLKGDYNHVKKDLTQKMEDAAESLEFERAKEYRDLLRHIEATVEKQKMALNDGIDRDVFGYAQENGYTCIQVFFIRQGKVIEREVSIFDAIDAVEEEALTFIGRFYQGEHLMPKEILIPPQIDAELLQSLLECKVLVPKQGQKKELVALAMKNAGIALNEKQQLMEINEERTLKAAEKLGTLLSIGIPHRIEAYDNSHHQGQDSVSAMIVFTDGRPDKKQYRKYKIKTAEDGDDYQAMREVIYRRYFRVLNEGLPAADLIVIDGGAGQVNVVTEVLKTLGFHDLPVIGLVKDARHVTSHIYDGRDGEEIHLRKTTNVFRLLSKIQEEVHRYVIGFHRNLSKKRNLTSILDEIPGVGPKRKTILIREFQTLERMLEAPDEAYEKLRFPPATVARIRIFLQEEIDKKTEIIPH
ncbi:MAG: excinuclease ABC subunit UvrC [Turicibacter sp.]|nr:excinuclease ABC subunit UvrC [Turicibacter sp.]